MTDVLMILEENGGNIVIAGREGDSGPYSGEVMMTDGPETDIVNALFGGHTENEWWGNLLGDVSYKSQTQIMLETMPMTTANIIRLETAIRKDLAAADMTEIGDVSVSIPQPNRVSIAIGDIVIERDWT